LYLRNLGSRDDEFLCYGITEDLIVDLTRIGTLRVAPMRKILKYKDSDDELEEIAAKLDVGLILDGSIQKSGESIRVSATLIDALSGKNLWAERWEESAGNLARIKQGLAQGIGAALEVGTRVIKEAEVGRPEAHSSQAYEMYLRGKYSFDRKKDATDVEVALGLYRKALIEEPGLTSAGYGIAEIHIYQGEYAKAIEELRRARDEARRIQSRPDEAAILRLTARASTLLSKWDEAYRLADESRRISATIGDASGEASAIGEMIIVLERRAKFPEALTWFERVVEIGLRLDDKEAIADAYKNMGNVYFRMGQYEKARELYKQSIEIARKRGDRMTEAKCMANIGLTLTHAAKLSQALDCYETSLQIYDQLGEQAGKALVLNNIALVHSAEGKYEEAIRMYDQAAEVHEALGNKSDFSLVLSNKARLLAIMGRYDEGIEFAERAQKIAAELDYPFVTNLAEDSIGYALQCRGDYEPAREHYQTALDVSQQAGLTREHALAHLNLGICAYYLGDYERTLVEAGEADRLAHEIGEGYIGLRAKAYLAAVEVHRGEFESGIDRLREALKDDEQFGDPRNILDAQRLLGSLLLTYARSSGERIEGKLLLEQALELALKKGVVYERQRIEKLIENH
jgi:tetratricopeptide (TPR) repeat protein